MRNIITIILSIIFMSTSSMAVAQTEHNHDPDIVGTWFSSANDGSLTELEMQDTGKFIFDQRSGSTVERTYMCGTWERRGKNLDLDIQAQKNRLADGEIEQAVGATAGNFKVIKATRNSLILRINQSVVSFYRTS